MKDRGEAEMKARDKAEKADADGLKNETIDGGFNGDSTQTDDQPMDDIKFTDDPLTDGDKRNDDDVITDDPVTVDSASHDKLF